MAIKTFPLTLKASETTGHVPASLLVGELAQNVADEKLFYRGADGSVKAMPLGGAVGKQTFVLLASGMKPADVSGAVPSELIGVVNPYKASVDTLTYDPATNQYAFALFSMPKGWNGGAFEARITWTYESADGGASGQTCRFGLAWKGSPDDSVFLASLNGTFTSVDDTAIVSTRTHITPWVTVPASRSGENEASWLSLMRKASDAADTLAGKCHVAMIEIRYTTNAATDD